MPELELTAAEANALDGSTDSETGFVYHVPGQAQYYTAGQRQRHRLLTLAKALGNRFRVYPDGAATFGVRPGSVRHGAATLTYGGSEGNTLTDDATNYIYLYVSGGSLTLGVSTAGFPDPALTPHLPLATITMASGSYSFADITDCRQLAGFRLNSGMTADDENTLTDGSSADGLHLHGTAGLADAAVTVAKCAEALQDLLPNVSLSAGPESADARLVTVQVRDAANNALGARMLVRVWIAPTDYGAPDAAGHTTAVTTGTVYETELADAAWKILTDASGTAAVRVTVSGEASRYVMAELDGRVYSSGRIDWAA